MVKYNMAFSFIVHTIFVELVFAKRSEEKTQADSVGVM